MIENFLSRLEKVKLVGQGRYIACCSAHPDKTPSLSIALLHDGRILIHCFAGCEPVDIINAVGLEMMDLFPRGCLGEFRGWEQHKKIIEQKQKTKQLNNIDDLRIILAVASGMRKEGLKLTRAEMEREKLAYIEVHNYDRNNGQ